MSDTILDAELTRQVERLEGLRWDTGDRDGPSSHSLLRRPKLAT